MSTCRRAAEPGGGTATLRRWSESRAISARKPQTANRKPQTANRKRRPRHCRAVRALSGIGWL
ncbi:hypothetical protein D2V84_18105 [Burkholderia pseudomallei]|nr:hypothetical protein B9D88_022110 [Burkholderia pseudomallei]RIV62214.1 hypothetical protein D2W72_28910 [Burkholderia pseudomallei]RIV76344.1 hypothetical protein D2V84_18105 [Burkholderia pseudomallei]